MNTETDLEWARNGPENDKTKFTKNTWFIFSLCGLLNPFHVHFSPFLGLFLSVSRSILVHFGPFLGPFRSVLVSFCPFLGPFQSVSVRFGPFLGPFRSVSVRFGPFLSVSVRFGPFRPVLVRFGPFRYSQAPIRMAFQPINTITLTLNRNALPD